MLHMFINYNVCCISYVILTTCNVNILKMCVFGVMLISTPNKIYNKNLIYNKHATLIKNIFLICSI